MKVCVSVHGRFHAFELARELDQNGYLAALLTTYPKTRVGVPNTVSVPWLEVWRRLAQTMPVQQPRTQLRIARAFGRFASANLPVDADILVGWSGATLEAIPVARDRGMRVVIERGSSHIRHQSEVLTEAFARHGIAFTDTPAEMIERECVEYEAADAISVPSDFAAQTFIEQGVSKSKLMINPYGVDLSQFSPPEQSPENSVPRILFVGGVGIRKGVPELLSAFQPFVGRAELHLVGPVEPSIRPLLSLGPGEGVFVRGPLSRQSVAEECRRADIFCLPSWEEGFPLALLQAMASELPVIASDATGAADIITDGVDGVVITAGDDGRLETCLSELIEDRARRLEMGAAARLRVNSGWDWGSYGKRAIRHYKGLLSEPVIVPTGEIE